MLTRNRLLAGVSAVVAAALAFALIVRNVVPL